MEKESLAEMKSWLLIKSERKLAAHREKEGAGAFMQKMSFLD